MGWQVERIAGTCGAIVRGVDLTRPQTPEQTAELTALLDEHLVVALPDQFLELDQLERATDELGGRDITPYVKPVDGRPYVIRGTCNHQDHAGVGVALPDRLQSFRLERLKEMGSNAYRSAHNPPRIFAGHQGLAHERD